MWCTALLDQRRAVVSKWKQSKEQSERRGQKAEQSELAREWREEEEILTITNEQVGIVGCNEGF